jgi:hypothetical protein
MFFQNGERWRNKNNKSNKNMMDRRKFIETTLKGSAVALAAGLPSLTYSQVSPKRTPILPTDKPLAIVMWDYSWILRHHHYGEFEDWDKVLDELVERGYNAIRLDAMPQFIASSKDGTIIESFRSIKYGWIPSMWGNDYTMSFRPREALVEFLTKCKSRQLQIGLSSWFMPHGTTERNEIFLEEGGLYRAWDETLTFLGNHNLLDNVIYVDLLNEYPNWHGYDWLKNELNKLANTTDKMNFYNHFINNLILSLKAKYPALGFFASLDFGVENMDLTNFAVADCHLWFQHHGTLPGLDAVSSLDQGNNDYRVVMNNLKAYWLANKPALTTWMDGRMRSVSQMAASLNIICGNTEGWGAIFWIDHPELDWSFIKESAEICINLSKTYSNYKFICTSNFTHPQFKGIWNDVNWHKAMTAKIRS